MSVFSPRGKEAGTAPTNRIWTIVAAGLFLSVAATVSALTLLPLWVQGPYDAYLGPSPLGLWLLGVVIAVPATLAAIQFVRRPGWGLMLPLSLGLVAMAAYLFSAWSLQAVGLLCLCALIALAFMLLAIWRLPTARSKTAVIVLTCVVLVLTGGFAGLAGLVRSMDQTKVWGRSPDGRHVLIEDYYDPGAMGFATDQLDVEWDRLGLIRHERTVYVCRDQPYVKDVRWLDDSHVQINSLQRVSIHDSPPPGW